MSKPKGKSSVHSQRAEAKLSREKALDTQLHNQIGKRVEETFPTDREKLLAFRYLKRLLGQ